MEISLQEQDGCLVLSITGRLDAIAAPLLQSRFEEVLTPEKRRFIVDMAGVDYISSGGLRVLMIMTKKLSAMGGGIVLVQLHPFVEDILRMSGYHTLIPAAASREDAVKLLEEGDVP
jgi:anti-anti-sigma factor